MPRHRKFKVMNILTLSCSINVKIFDIVHNFEFAMRLVRKPNLSSSKIANNIDERLSSKKAVSLS